MDAVLVNDAALTEADRLKEWGLIVAFCNTQGITPSPEMKALLLGNKGAREALIQRVKNQDRATLTRLLGSEKELAMWQQTHHPAGETVA